MFVGRCFNLGMHRLADERNISLHHNFNVFKSKWYIYYLAARCVWEWPIMLFHLFFPAAQVLFLEFSTGGFGWIPNLTDVDHSLILPIAMGIINIIITEVWLALYTMILYDMGIGCYCLLVAFRFRAWGPSSANQFLQEAHVALNFSSVHATIYEKICRFVWLNEMSEEQMMNTV